MKHKICLGGMLLAISLLTGCASVTVENTSDIVPAVIKLKVPDSTGYDVMRIAPGNAVGLVSIVGGAYSLVVIPDQEYTAKLDKLRDDIETKLILHATEIDPDSMFALTDALKDLQG